MALPKLGSKAQDKGTGFTGTVTAEFRELGGRRSYKLEGIDKDGKPTELWVERGRLESAEPPANPGVGGAADDGEE